MYMAHFMGAGGAGNFLSKDPNAIAAQLFPKEAAANKWIFYKTERKGGRMAPNLNMPLTIGGVYQLMQQKVNKAQSVYGGRTQGAPSFADVKSSVSTTASRGDTVPSNAVPATPTTTTTTANGPTGGVGAAQAAAAKPSVGTPVALQAGSSGTDSLKSGGGYAAMASGAGYGAAAAAPSITSTASLDAASASQRADESDRVAAAERERQAREARTRAAEAQTMRQSQTDQAQMSRVGEILQQSLETQRNIERNTADAVTVLRDLLRKSGAPAGPAQSSPAAPAAPETRPASQRPTQRQTEKVPVSVRFSEPNG